MSDRYDEWSASLTTAEVVKRAGAELSRLCKGGDWRMSIPVNLDYDSDVILGEAIRRLRAADSSGKRLTAAGSPPDDEDAIASTAAFFRAQGFRDPNDAARKLVRSMRHYVPWERPTERRET